MTIIIKDIIDALTTPIGVVPDSVDQLLFGNPRSIVKGIAVTFMATQQVLEKASRLGTNLIITHEGVFYSHYHSKSALVEDPVYDAKKRFIADSDLAIFRFHDGIHRHRPDGIMEGLLRSLGWEAFVTEHLPAASVVNLPISTVGEVAEHVKKRLGIETLRAVGDLSMACRRIGLLAGYRGGGELAIPLFERHKLDLILYGEGPEWETPEYARDAVDLGLGKALLVLGHLESEQPGMKLLADRLRSLFPVIPVHFLTVDPVFRIV
ncbi:Nif3-like dinuclear metal center hexameric protein [Cohnella luojiensis]|uniref:GTP cyclohydrolase 1 type 2 homolog n=1 Tax=Cohnella luojiensis TaxID=652876 RepID=A0A4Y8LWH7_9BACL|nr:Nif3-like dinuclear metal center hexameric protein [Cohnella luojiensis]TFE25369.1 transcriptional regulator [Cohnella luojiensis]